ncbi:hypothetical protein GPECTOR_18g15 [Gonium pectorale]|uniref:Peptidase C1A papain C-terminal domain-containing protein n=1 Tax=Gonium pectorale TaxID=33097 RepID=A0A150GJR5_GONPE|nr:hypothetical protein GPECTOR_18g15 [Gonium pectorale]|eukprot:KXZ49994.1 hypothetical protein GPECTOR_18g15 [Gonium pectorale]
MKVNVRRVLCPSVANYTFYRLQDVPGAYLLQSLNGTIPAPVGLGAVCGATPRCSAFTTMGDLKVVPMAPLFSVMDGSASDVLSCDGIYIATDGRTLAGLLPPVAKQLQSQNIDPRTASSLQPEELRKAFAAAKVPLAQEDKAVGSYTFSQVLAALNDPVWDSRRVVGPGNTAISYVSPVKDQGSCGACVAFAATAIAEIAVAVANESAVNTNDYSEQW